MPIRIRFGLLAATVLVAGLTAACGSSGGSSSTAQSGFPMTIENCGHMVTISHRPSWVMTISDDATNDVAAAGGLNLIVATAVASSAPVFTTETAAKMKIVPIIGGRDSSLSKEEVLGAKPDIVIGEDDQGVSVDELDGHPRPTSPIALVSSSGGSERPTRSQRSATRSYGNILAIATIVKLGSLVSCIER